MTQPGEEEFWFLRQLGGEKRAGERKVGDKDFATLPTSFGSKYSAHPSATPKCHFLSPNNCFSFCQKSKANMHMFPPPLLQTFSWGPKDAAWPVGLNTGHV